MNAFPLLLLLVVAPCALGNPVAKYLNDLATSATEREMTLNYIECQDGAKNAAGNACQDNKVRLFEIKALKCTVKILKQSAKCVSGTVELGPPGYTPPMSVSQTEINLADKTGQIVLQTPPTWQKYGFQLSRGVAGIAVDAQGIVAVQVDAQGKYETKDANGQTKLLLNMAFNAFYRRPGPKVAAFESGLRGGVTMTVQVGARTGKATDIPVLQLVGMGEVVKSNPILILRSQTIQTTTWQPFANGPYAKQLIGQATITDAGLTAVQIVFEVGWSGLTVTLPKDIDFNNCPAPTCKTKQDSKCKKNCKWTEDADPAVAATAFAEATAKAAAAAAKAAAKAAVKSYLPFGYGRRNLLFGPLPRNGSMPLDTSDLSDLDPFLGEVRVGDATVFAGDMEGYAEDAEDELSLGTESFGSERFSVDQSGVSINILDHKCSWKLSECPVEKATSQLQVKVAGALFIDVQAAKMWGEVNLNSQGSVTIFPITRPIDLAFSGPVFKRTEANKLDIMDALGDLSFCALVNAATEGGMGNIPIGWQGVDVMSRDIYDKVLGKYLTNGKLDLGQFLPVYLTKSIPTSTRNAMKLEKKDLPQFKVFSIPSYTGTLSSAFTTAGAQIKKVAGVDTTCGA